MQTPEFEGFNEALSKNTPTSLTYTYPGGLPRTLQARVEDYVSVEDFGARPSNGDGAASQDINATAFTNAINTGRTVYVPAGTYFINGTIFSSRNDVSIIGEGERITQLWFTNPGDGIVADVTGRHQVHLEGLMLTNSGSGGGVGTALKILNTEGGEIYNTVVINDVQIKEDWTKGIEFNKTSQIKVNNLVAFLNNAESILHLRESCLDSSFENMHIGVGGIGSNDTVGMLIDGQTGVGNEGIRVTNSTFLKTNIGLKFDGGIFEPHLSVSECHFNCQTSAIVLKDAGQSFIHHNLFYAWTTGGSPDPSEFKNATIIKVDGSRGGEATVISENVFHALARKNYNPNVVDTGIEWASSTTDENPSLISNNIFTGVDYGIRTTGSVQCLKTVNNQFSTNVLKDNQISVANGAVADSSLSFDASRGSQGKVSQHVRNLGPDGRQVELKLSSNDKNFIIKQNQVNGAEMYYEDALQFISDSGTNQPRLDLQLSDNGTAIFFGNVETRQNFYLTSPNGRLWHLKVNDNGSIQTIGV